MPRRIPVHRPRSHRTEAERKRLVDANRPSPSKRGYGRRWRAYSKERLKQYPWCERCKQSGRYVSAQCTDHIVPVDGPDDPLFWVPSNHQSLCYACHGIKTATEDGGFGNVRRSEAAAQFIGVEPIGHRWKASIGKGRGKRYLGLFATPQEAALAYNRAAVERYGPKARINQLGARA